MSKLQMGMVIAASVAIGAIGGSQLRAQAKAPAYFINEIDVQNVDGYLKEYAPKGIASVKAQGGKFLVATKAVTTLEGEAPKPETRIVISVWESMDALQAWYRSPEYHAAHDIGSKYAKYRTLAVEELPPTSPLRQ